MIFKAKMPKHLMPEFDILKDAQPDLYKIAIKNAVETYPLEWRVLFETIQNSIDAIEKNDAVKEGKISVIFNLDENSITIKDNGIGFPFKKDLFFLNGGTKTDDKKSKGKIGVGLKVTIFSSKHFYVRSVYKDEVDGKNKLWTAEIDDAYKYKDKTAVNAKTSELQDTKEPIGTVMTYSFPDESILEFIKNATRYMRLKVSDKIERQLGEKFKILMQNFLRTNGYLADTMNLIDEKHSKKTITDVQITYGKMPVGLEKDLSDVFIEFNGNIQFSVEDKYWDIEEIINKQKGKNKPTIINHKIYKNPKQYGKFNPDTHIWVKHFTDKDEMRELLSKKDIDKYDALLKKVNGIYIVLGSIDNMKKFYFRAPYQFISVNGVPSDHLLPRPTSATMYTSSLICIIDVDSTLNYGKLQTTNRNLIHNCGEFYIDIYKHSIRKIGEAILGNDIGDDTSASSVEKSTAIITLDDLGIDSSLQKEPIDENALIALFFDLLGRGIIKDYKFYSLHSKRKYDATAMIKTENMPSIPTPTNDSDLRYVEFKLRLSELLDDLENKDKVLKDMTLIIVWENDVTDLYEEYDVIDLEDSKDKNSGFFGVKKCLMNRLDGIERQVFIMKEFISDLKISKKTAA